MRYAGASGWTSITGAKPFPNAVPTIDLNKWYEMEVILTGTSVVANMMLADARPENIFVATIPSELLAAWDNVAANDVGLWTR